MLGKLFCTHTTLNRRKPHHLCRRFLALVLFFSSFPLYSEQLPPVQLAQVYSEDLPINEYLVSEKYDGIRATWKDGHLRTRSGKPIHAPKWFVKNLPDIWLDGELWSKRQDFEFVASTVSKISPVDEEWRKIQYMVFDAPDASQRFSQRVKIYTKVIRALDLPHLKAVVQFHVSSNTQLSTLLNQYTNAGAEGLMLHHAMAMHENGRSTNLFKLKPHMDDEAIVIEHILGKGKFRGN